MELGSVQTVIVKKRGQRCLVTGRLVESENPGTDAASGVLACAGAATEGLTERVEIAAAGAAATKAREAGNALPPVYYLRVPQRHLRPASGPLPADLPSSDTALATWLMKQPPIESSDTELLTADEGDRAGLRSEMRRLEEMIHQLSSRQGAEAARGSNESASSKDRPLPASAGGGLRGMPKIFKNLDDLWRDSQQDLDESDMEEELGDAIESDVKKAKDDNRKKVQFAWNPPGGGAAEPAVPSKARSNQKKVDPSQIALDAMARGQDTDSVLKYLLMTQLLATSRKKRQHRDSLEGSSSESSSDEDIEKEKLGKRGGLRAVRDLQELKRRIEKHPSRVIEEFETMVRAELGLVAGQAWTLRDWIERQSWGKFRSLQRAAHQDVAVYHFLRQGKPKQALAQLVQNIKSKTQAARDSGDWSMAWHLCTLEDPLRKKEWVGSETEIAVITGYGKSLVDIRKKAEEARLALRSPKEDG